MGIDDRFEILALIWISLKFPMSDGKKNELKGDYLSKSTIWQDNIDRSLIHKRIGPAETHTDILVFPSYKAKWYRSVWLAAPEIHRQIR